MRLCLVQETRCKFVLPFHSYYIADPSFSIMPPGLPHAVFSVSLQGYRPTSVLMSGSHFISEHSLPAMLEASISHSLWHDIWTNALHDDKIAHMAWMLDDFLRRTRAQHSSHRQESGGALGGVQAFALIAWGALAPWLISLPHQTSASASNPRWLETFDPLEYLTGRLHVSPLADAATSRMLAMLDQVGRMADVAFKRLALEDQEAFAHYYKDVCAKFANEIIRRTDYNLAVSTKD